VSPAQGGNLSNTTFILLNTTSGETWIDEHDLNDGKTSRNVSG
jgi:hypothetical protein